MRWWAKSVSVLALLGGCAGANQEQAQRDTFPVTFAFAGDELAGRPSPRGVIFGDRMIYRSTGAGWYQANIEREATATGWRIITGDDVAVTIERGGCSEPKPFRVAIRLAGETFRGCGGTPVTSPGLADTTWVLRALVGQMAPDGSSPAATVTFASSGAFGGTSACNDVNAGSDRRWRTDATGTSGRFERVETDGPVSGIQTVMGCPDPATIEMGGAFWRAMRDARSWRREGDRLTISFADGSSAILLLLL